MKQNNKNYNFGSLSKNSFETFKQKKHKIPICSSMNQNYKNYNFGQMHKNKMFLQFTYHH